MSKICIPKGKADDISFSSWASENILVIKGEQYIETRLCIWLS